MSLSSLQIILLTLNLNFIVIGGLLFLKQKGHITLIRVLAVTIILLGFINSHFVLLYSRQIYLNFPQFIGTHVPFLFLVPPLIYVFYKVIFNSSYPIWKNFRYHVFPALVILIVYFPLYFSSIDYKVEFIKTGECFIPNHLLGGLFFVQFFGYLIVIFSEVSTILKSSKDVLNVHLKSYLNTVRLIDGMLVLSLFSIFLLEVNLIHFSIITSIVFYYMIYQVVVHPEIFHSCQFVTSELTLKKYKSNALDQKMVDEIYEKVLDYMGKEKIYLDCKISLPDLSYQLDIPTHHLSQAINRKSSLNFNDFINRYRSEHCKKILLDETYQHYTMAAIGELSGFKSRQTFIKSFKKFYNLTPSEYIKSKNIIH